MINLIQPLPFYDRITEQQRFKENSYGLSRFLSPSDTLIPFQIKVPIEAVEIQSIIIRGFSNEFEIDLPANNDFFYFKTVGGKKRIIYRGEQLTFVRENGDQEPLIIAPDYYWFEVTVDDKTFFSEVFCVPGEGICDEPINLTIEAWDDKNSNDRFFEDGFKFRAYFHSMITNVVPDITDEFTKDGYERQILLRRVIVFQHNIELDPMPNSISIGIAYLTTLKYIIITFDNNDYVVKDITYKPDPVEGGSLDAVQLTFTIFDEDVIKTGC